MIINLMEKRFRAPITPLPLLWLKIGLIWDLFSTLTLFVNFIISLEDQDEEHQKVVSICAAILIAIRVGLTAFDIKEK